MVAQRRGLIAAANANVAAAVAAAATSSSRGSTSAGPVPDVVPHVGPRQLSKRREQSAVHLHNVMNQVQDQLVAVPQQNVGIYSMCPTGQSSPEPTEAPCSPASLRKNISLRFPRVSASGHGDSAHAVKDSAESGPATASTSATSYAGTSQLALVSDNSSQSGAANRSEELEDLRLQNAVLRRSLAMLQQSVVDSMKGNRSQFMGNGIFRQQQPSTAGGQRPSVGGSSSSSALAAANAAQQDADLEGLRTALAERRASLRDALLERDEALREAQAARREAAELALKNEVLAAELKDCQARLEEANAARLRAEAERDTAARRAVQLEADASDLNEQVSSARRALAEAEEKASALQRDLEAALRARDGATAAAEADRAALQAEIARLEDVCGTDQGRLAQLSEQRKNLAKRILGSALIDSRSWLRACLGSWFALCMAEREARLDERACLLEEDVARHASEASMARSESEALRSSVEEQRKEAEDASRRAGEVEQRYASAANEASQWKVRAEKAEARVQVLDREVRTAKELSEAASNKAALDLKAAEDRLRQLEAELAALQGANGEASRKASAISEEASAREAELHRELQAAKAELQTAKADLQAAKDAAKHAREAEAAASRQRDEARQRTLEHEHQKKAIAAELEASKARAGQMAKEVQGARGRAEEAEKRVRELQGHAEELQRRAQELEAREVQETQRCKDAEQSQAAELARASKEVDGLVHRNQQLTAEAAELRISLAEAKCDSKSATEKLRVLREEHATVSQALDKAKACQQLVERRSEELQGLSSRFASDARKALEEARQNIRIMVTAPKVAVNVGGQSVDMHTPFPFCAIREAVEKEVMPNFARVFAVGEQAGDSQIRQDVQDMVEKLALTLQTKVHELLPQAEGTCNWDGFGSKCGALGKR